jgi:hypothetical protein
VSKISVIPSSYVTGRITTYKIQFQTSNPIPGNGYVLVQLPPEIAISDTNALPNACMVAQFGATCVYLSTNPDIIKVTISQPIAAAAVVLLTFTNILSNPRSTKQSSSFQLATYTSDNFMID